MLMNFTARKGLSVKTMGSGLNKPLPILLLIRNTLKQSIKRNYLDKNSIEGGDIMNELKQTHNDILASLVDIRDVKIDRKLPVEDRIKSYVEQVKNPYLFKVGETIVRVSYANTQATINDNFINMIASM